MTADEKKPSEAHLKIIRNIAAGRYELAGFIHDENGTRAYFECILRGWVSKGKLTDEGYKIFETHPIKVKVTVVSTNAAPQPDALAEAAPDLRVLLNLAAGRDVFYGFASYETGAQALLECIRAGWVTENRTFTPAGRSILADTLKKALEDNETHEPN